MKIITTDDGTTFDFEDSSPRSCGSHDGRCSLCCKLLPMKALEKGANQRRRQRRRCRIYPT
jgi:hypothetical protein